MFHFEAFAGTTTAVLYDLESNKKLYTYEATRTFAKTDMTYKGEYKNLDGSIAVAENATINKGTIQNYEIDSKQTGEKGKIYTKKGKIYFEYTDSKGKKTDSYTKLYPDTLVSANLIAHAQANLDKLIKDKTVPFKYAVWYRKEVISFRFTLDKSDDKTITIKMTPSNLLYRSMVDPIYYTLNKKTKELIESRGRVIPKKKVDGDWESLDAHVKYDVK